MLEIMGLLECYSTYDQDDIYFEIARSILENYNHLEISTLQSFAESLHISVSTANRFVRQLYYKNFSDFKHHTNKTLENYQYDGKYFASVREEIISPMEYSKVLCDKINEVMSELQQTDVEVLVSMIEASNEIIFIGIPTLSEVWRLQVELILMGKKTSAFIDPNYQVKEIEKVQKDSLVICLQCTRQQDSHNEDLVMKAKENGAKVVYIGSIKVKSIEQNTDLSIIYKGTNTHLDTTMMQMLLNYIGHYLRNRITG